MADLFYLSDGQWRLIEPHMPKNVNKRSIGTPYRRAKGTPPAGGSFRAHAVGRA